MRQAFFIGAVLVLSFLLDAPAYGQRNLAEAQGITFPGQIIISPAGNTTATGNYFRAYGAIRPHRRFGGFGGFGYGYPYYPYYGYEYYGSYWPSYYYYGDSFYFGSPWPSGFGYAPPAAAYPVAPAWSYSSYSPEPAISYYGSLLHSAPAAPPANRAQITIHAPQGAQVSIEGQTVALTGRDYTYLTEPLKPGQSQQYEVRVTWEENGRAVSDQVTVAVQAGDQKSVTFLPSR